MNILFCGDVVGRAGREVVTQHLPHLKKQLQLDFIIVNGENAANGFGITKEICENLYESGADVITTGNHVWDQKEIIGQIDNDPRLLRPANYPADLRSFRSSQAIAILRIRKLELKVVLFLV